MIYNYNEFLNEKYYDDLTPYTYDGVRGLKNPVNIGWLDKGEDYEKGEVPKGFLEKLEQAETISHHKGSHRCPFCNGHDSSTVLYVPGKGKNYIFPGMLTHYIRRHGYIPPQEFIDAVMGLPEPRYSERGARAYKEPIKTPKRPKHDISWINDDWDEGDIDG